MKISIVIYLFTLVFLTSCGSGHINVDEGARNVKISRLLPPHKYCREVGEVYASQRGAGDDLEMLLRGTRVLLRNRANDMKANYVTIDTSNTANFGGEIILAMSGTSYRCVSPQKMKSKNQGKMPENKEAPPKKEKKEEDSFFDLELDES